MARFQVQVTLIVEADDDAQAVCVADAVLDNAQGGAIITTEVDGVWRVHATQDDMSGYPD